MPLSRAVGAINKTFQTVLQKYDATDQSVNERRIVWYLKIALVRVRLPGILMSL